MRYKIERGCTYSAEFKLGFVARTASNQTIEKRLVAKGFVKVSVGGRGSYRTARGRWVGPSQTIDLPKQIIRIKRVT